MQELCTGHHVQKNSKPWAGQLPSSTGQLGRTGHREGRSPRCRCPISMIMRGSSSACTGTRLAQSQPKAVENDERGGHQEAEDSRRIVIRSRRCEARISAIGALRLIGEFALDHLAEDTLHLLEGDARDARIRHCRASRRSRKAPSRSRRQALAHANHVMSAQCPGEVLDGDAAVLGHVLEGLRTADCSLTLRMP